MPSHKSSLAKLAKKFSVLAEDSHSGRQSRFSKHGGGKSKFQPKHSKLEKSDKYVQKEHIAFKSTMPGHVFPLNMINSYGKVVMASVEMTKLPEYIAYQFASDVKVCLLFVNQLTPQNIADANRYKMDIFRFILDYFPVDKQLPYSFQDIYCWEDDICAINGKNNAFYQRIILSYILTLNNNVSTGMHSTTVFAIGCIAGVCAYIEYIAKKQYTSETFKAELYSVIY